MNASTRMLRRCMATAAALAALAALHPAMAGESPQAKDPISMAMMDKNKDGKVTRAEFLDAMGKYYDMKAKEMGAKDGRIDAGQLDAMRRAMFQQ